MNDDSYKCNRYSRRWPTHAGQQRVSKVDKTRTSTKIDKITKSTTVENIDIDKKSRKMNKIDKICRHKRYRAERSRRKGRDPHNTSKTNNNKVYTYGFGTYCCPPSLVCVFVMDDINNNKVLQQKVRSYYDDIIPSLQLPTQQITTRDNMRTNTHTTTATSLWERYTPGTQNPANPVTEAAKQYTRCSETTRQIRTQRYSRDTKAPTW